jgi:hypothetical protein
MNAEIDFVAERTNEKLYIQVTETLMGEETRERELRSLRLIKDNYEKIVLSMDHDFISSYDGILCFAAIGVKNKDQTLSDKE